MIDTSNMVGNTLSWVVVKDIEASLAYYTGVLGFQVECNTPEYGWAELKAPQGARVALAQENPMAPFKAGTNAILTIEVRDIEAAKEQLVQAGTTLHGEIEEIPDHVRMLTFEDSDGNMMQLAQKLDDAK